MAKVGQGKGIEHIFLCSNVFAGQLQKVIKLSEIKIRVTLSTHKRCIKVLTDLIERAKIAVPSDT